MTLLRAESFHRANCLCCPSPQSLLFWHCRPWLGVFTLQVSKKGDSRGIVACPPQEGLLSLEKESPKGASSSSLSPLLEGELGRGQKQSLCGGCRLGSNSQRLQLGRLRWSRRRTGCPEGVSTSQRWSQHCLL